LDEEGMECMKRLIEEQPGITLKKIKEAMNLSICVSAISRKMKHKLGFNNKKNTAWGRTKFGEEPIER
jgi:predicted transcriptional regulator